MKLCLGTVQFGLDYGLRGKTKPSLGESVRLIEYAVANGIDAIDTAEAYGTAQLVLGTFLSRYPKKRTGLTIGSKFMPNILDDVPVDGFRGIIKKHLTDTLKTLHTDYLDYYLFHSARYIFDEEKLSALADLKSEGLVRRVGVSVYNPEEAEHGFLSESVDMIQLPFSLFDRRMETTKVFERWPDRIILHTRSAFLQGLITMSAEELPPFLSRAADPLNQVRVFCRTHGISPVKLALWYVRSVSPGACLVFGVHEQAQLEEDIHAFSEPFDESLLKSFADHISGLTPDIVMPSLWKK